MPRATDNAVYNSRIAGMLTPSFFRRCGFVVLLPILLLAATAAAQNWAGAEEQLATKIVAVTGQRAIAVGVSTRASVAIPNYATPSSATPSFATPGLATSGLATTSLSAATVDDIRRGLLTHLAALGARLVNAEQAEVTVRVWLSESLQNYVWVAEIQQNATQDSTVEASVVMVSWPRPETRAAEPVAAAMALHKTSLWSEQDRILDIAVIEGNPAHMLVLDSRGVTSYRLRDGRWQGEQSLAITHSRPWPRDLRGRLAVHKDHLFDAYLPGVFCRSTGTSPLASPLTMTCNEGEDAWPIGTEGFSLNAAFVSARNYFSGALLPGVGRQMATSPFYSAAAVPRGQSTLWLFADVDGQVHLLDGATDQVTGNLGWGSDIASIKSGCGSGSQVLATGGGEGSSDTVRGFEVPNREPAAVTAPLEINGSITALWTESGESSALVVVRDSETGGYEALRLTLTCSR